MDQLVERQIQLGPNPTVFFVRNPNTYTGWKLQLTPPSRHRAFVNAPDSLGWSLSLGQGSPQSSVVIGCGTDQTHANVVWVGPENENRFHTTVHGTLTGCGGTLPGTVGGKPDFHMDLRGGNLVIKASPQDAMVGETVQLNAVYQSIVDGVTQEQAVEVLWNSSALDFHFVDQNGYIIQDLNNPRSSILAATLYHGNYQVTANLENGIITAPVNFYDMAFLQDQDTVYNFSPTMGEVSKLKYELLPAVGVNTQVPGLVYEIEIVRELLNGDDQLVDEVNLDPNTIFTPRLSLDLTAPRVTEWNGIPKPLTFGGGGVGNTIPQSTGGGSPFQGVNAQFHRILPEIHVNQPVPPPLYTARLVVTRHMVIGQPRVPVYETRKNVFVPQVVLIRYEDQRSIDAVMEEYIVPKERHNWPNDVYIYKTTQQTFGAYAQTKIQKIRNMFSDVNIRFTYNQNELVGSGFGVVRNYHNPLAHHWGEGEAENRFGNPNPAFTVSVFTTNIRNDVSWEYKGFINTHILNMSPLEFPHVPFIEYNLSNMAHAVAFTTIHEVGHGLGLVQPGDILDGRPDEDGWSLRWHNKPPYYSQKYYIMNPGAVRGFQQRWDLNQNWMWKELNLKYLQFILPFSVEVLK